MDFVPMYDQKILRIALSGKFTYADNQRFRDILETIRPETQVLELDFGKVEFIDSAGLGMLLMLRETCHNRDISLTIHSIHGQVEKVFLVSKFDQLFSVQRQ